MGWLVAAVVILAVVALLALLAPTIFGVALAGLVPVLIVVALLGIGVIWWRAGKHRVDPQGKGDQE